MIEKEKRDILDCIRAGLEDTDIMAKLNIPRRMFQRRMNMIRQSHLNEVMDQQSAEAKASVMRETQQKLKSLELQAEKILNDPYARNNDKLEAMDRIRTFRIDQAKLIIEGPTLFRIIPRDGLHRGLEATALELRDTPVLQEQSSTNDERQF